jgi:hypothetical protein
MDNTSQASNFNIHIIATLGNNFRSNIHAWVNIG